MKRIRFFFSTKITMNHHVHSHSYLFRCLPIETPSQHVEELQFSMLPNQLPNRGVDAFGNQVLSGYIVQEHRYLDFTVRGVTLRDDTKSKTDFMPCYRYPSPMTKADEGLRRFFQECESETSGMTAADAIAEQWMHRLYAKMRYVKHSTDVTTTAAEAFAAGQGVCQDYTHILLALLRMKRIPCRYIAGLAFDEGETHSWLELWDGTRWIGFDPTNDRKADERYLILSQGRDSQDCALNRGVMFGAYTQQMQLVESKLEELLQWT